MKPEFVLPYIISNAFAVAALILAIFAPKAARWVVAAVFLAASIANTRMAILNPADYLFYADLALPAYRPFILGFFAQHITEIVLMIAAGQFAIFLLLAINGGRFIAYGVLGTCVFLLAIAPLGVGSAFPFSLIFGAAAVVMWRRLRSETNQPAIPASDRATLA